MDPLSTIMISSAATRMLGLVEWEKVLHGLANDAARDQAKRLFGRLKPSEREKTARVAIALFLHEWDTELEDKCPLSSALTGYRDQVQRLIESAAPDIVEWLSPDTTEVDLGPVERMWSGLKLDPLPEGFSWKLVAQNYGRAIRKHIKNDPELRSALAVALQERSVAAAERMAGPDPGFNLAGYREFLQKKCGALQLAVMHTSAHHFDRQITLWSVFVPQSARASAPIVEIPDEIRRRLRAQGHLTDRDTGDLNELRIKYRAAALRPVLDVLDRERIAVILGNPGSGKTSLLKYLALRWANEDQGPLPLFVDLREYVRERHGLPEYFESGSATYRLDAREIDERLKAGSAILFLDGLDEVFDPSTRRSVIEEIAALASRYLRTPIVVTSRIVGYEPERLKAVGFFHATLEDFDDQQVQEFLGRWHKVAEDDAKERARLQTRIDLALADSGAIRELAGNPLLLTMMAILNRNQELPRDRVELYREASRVLLREWDSSRALPVDEFAWQDKEALLRELAGDMQQIPGCLAGNLIDRGRLIERFRIFLAGLGIQDSYQKASLLVQRLIDRNFILCFAGADNYSFVHRTFLEYYCAAWFVERFEKKQDLTLKELQHKVFGRHWKDEKWHEVLRLIAGMLEEKKAEEIILYLMSLDGSNEELRNLFLAGRCLGEVRNRRALQTTSQTLFQRLLDEWVGHTHTVLAIQAAVRCLAEVWRNEGAHDWLKSAVTEYWEPIVRQAALQELARGWKDDPDTLIRLRNGARYDVSENVRRTAVQEVARRWKHDPDTLTLLKDRARSDESEVVRFSAVQLMAQDWKEHPDTSATLMDRALHDRSVAVRRAAVHELEGSKDYPEVAALLQQLPTEPPFDLV